MSSYFGYVFPERRPPRFHAAADLAEDEEVAGNLAQACRSLRSILAVAVAVEVIAADPCRLRNAGTPKAARPSPALTVARPLAEQLATDRAPSATGLRCWWSPPAPLIGGATGLRRHDVSAAGAWLTVSRSVRYVDGTWLIGDPKTDAGRRTVSLPASVAAARHHLDRFVPRRA